MINLEKGESVVDIARVAEPSAEDEEIYDESAEDALIDGEILKDKFEAEEEPAEDETPEEDEE
jgi:hypothetical protein